MNGLHMNCIMQTKKLISRKWSHERTVLWLAQAEKKNKRELKGKKKEKEFYEMWHCLPHFAL